MIAGILESPSNSKHRRKDDALWGTGDDAQLLLTKKTWHHSYSLLFLY